jgi:methylated-DNA-[protein]-cysteine S-methyltransferase
MSNNNLHQGFYNSPIGMIRVTASENEITEVCFVEQGLLLNESQNELVKKCIEQLSKYFEGSLSKFDLPLAAFGTDFQEKVLKEVQKVPYGNVASYLQIAKRIGETSAVRAVGNVNSKNKFLIVIPCHRVVGNNGEMTGYAGGIWRKKWLLNHESKLGNVGQISLFG